MRTRDRLTAATLGTALAFGLFSPITANAHLRPADRVRISDLPTVAQVARHYPDFAGGSRDVYRNRRTHVRSADCLAWENGPRAASGRWATYNDAAGDSPYFSGGTQPTVSVYKFPTRRKARAAFRTLRSSAVRCLGEHSEDGYAISSTRVGLPDLGAARFGYRSYQHETTGGTTFEDHFLTLLSRRGRYLVETMAQKETSGPAKRPLVRLTRVTLHRTR